MPAHSLIKGGCMVPLDAGGKGSVGMSVKLTGLSKGRQQQHL